MPSLKASRGEVSLMAKRSGMSEIQINQSVFNGGKDAVIKSPDSRASRFFFAGNELIY